jgi:hypothetical protein
MVGATFTTGTFASYAGVEEVLALLAGFDLSALGDTAAVSAYIEALLPKTKLALDGAIGRDYEWHQGDTLEVDGTGHSWLFLFRYGRHPIIQVTSVEVDGQALEPDGYVVYEREGYVRLDKTTGQFFATVGGRAAPGFPLGARNVRVTLDWGYATPPDDIVLAQAKLMAAQVLAQAAGAAAGAAERVTIGDYAVSYASGPHAATVGRWLRDVEETVRRQRRVAIAAV